VIAGRLRQSKTEPEKNMAVLSVSKSENDERSKRDEMILEHLSLVRAIALRVHETLPVYIELEDLEHAGILGLFDAVSRYDESKQVSFQNYAKHRIRGAMLDSLREQDWASRDTRRRQKRLEAVVREMSTELGRSPFDHEVAARLGVSDERWNQMMFELRAGGPAPNRAANDDEPVPEHRAEPDWQPDQMCQRWEMHTRLEGAIKALPERQRKVVAMYYGDGLSMKEIGVQMGVNESRVSQIHKAALEKMGRTLREQGILSVQALLTTAAI
jgi:RNA polymerase sigma factor for flagellar operon FliA